MRQSGKRASRPTLLIADDDDAIRDVVRLILEEEGGYAVRQVSNGVAALEILRSTEEPLIVLLDWFMPDLSGEQLLRLVAADAALGTRHSFIISSATPTNNLHLDAFPPHLVSARLRKPFDIDALLDVVREAEERLLMRQRLAKQPVTGVSRAPVTGTL